MQVSNSETPISTERTGAGSRTRGAAETIHGAGEQLRGRTMSALDDLTGTRHGRVDTTEISAKGRLDSVSQGTSQMHPTSKRPPRKPTTPTSTTSISTNPRRGGLSATGTRPARVGSIETHPNPQRYDDGNWQPRHHREDAISGIPSPQARELQRTASMDASWSPYFPPRGYN